MEQIALDTPTVRVDYELISALEWYKSHLHHPESIRVNTLSLCVQRLYPSSGRVEVNFTAVKARTRATNSRREIRNEEKLLQKFSKRRASRNKKKLQAGGVGM